MAAENNNTVETLPEYVLKMLENVAEEEGLSDYFVEQYPESLICDGLTAAILRASIIGKKTIDGIVMNTNLSLICKYPLLNSPYEALFKQEVCVYNHILPTISQFLKEKGISEQDGFDNFPKIYAVHSDNTKNQHAIIMEDLNASGYSLMSDLTSGDYNHAKLFLETIGKLHAISFALRDEKPEFLKECKSLRDFYTANAVLRKVKGIKGNTIMGLEKVIELMNVKDVLRIKKLQYFIDNLLEVYRNCGDSDASEPFSVLLHGDCKADNVMFLYNETKQPQNICFIDWQLTHYGSPALDLVNFIFSSTNKSLRDNHYEEFLQIYHKSLSNYLRLLGKDADRLFSYSDLQDQLKKFGKFGLLTSMGISNIESRNVRRVTTDDKAILEAKMIDSMEDCFNLGYC